MLLDKVVYVNYILLVDDIVELDCVLNDFCLSGVHNSEKGAEASIHDNGYIYFLAFLSAFALCSLTYNVRFTHNKN